MDTMIIYINKTVALYILYNIASKKVYYASYHASRNISIEFKQKSYELI